MKNALQATTEMPVLQFTKIITTPAPSRGVFSTLNPTNADNLFGRYAEPFQKALMARRILFFKEAMPLPHRLFVKPHRMETSLPFLYCYNPFHLFSPPFRICPGHDEGHTKL